MIMKLVLSALPAHRLSSMCPPAKRCEAAVKGWPPVEGHHQPERLAIPGQVGSVKQPHTDKALFGRLAGRCIIEGAESTAGDGCCKEH